MKRKIFCVVTALMFMLCMQPIGFAEEEATGEGTYFYLSAESILYEYDERQDNILYPVKVYENGFYDRSGFHLFNANTESVCDVFVEVLNYYYENSEETADGIMLENPDGNVPYTAVDGWVTLSVYNSNYDEYTDYDSNCCFSFNDNGDKSSGYVKWIAEDDFDLKITDGSVARWILSDSYYVFSDYESPACDDLIRAIGDYYEKSANGKASAEAEYAYYEAIYNFFDEDTQSYAEQLRNTLASEEEIVPAIAAVYDANSNLKGIKIYENAPDIDAATTDLNAQPGDTVKIFFWNSVESQEPIAGKTMISEIIR